MATPSDSNPLLVTNPELQPTGPVATPDKAQLSSLLETFSALPHDDELSEVERTARYVAGLKALDFKTSPCPLIMDPLAELLAGCTGMDRAKATLQASPVTTGLPGVHSHNALAVRAFILDKQILRALQDLRSQVFKIQVVNLGSGMDTRPWRLAGLGPDVDWWEVDQPDMITLKHKLLTEARAELTQRVEMQGQQQQAATTESPAGQVVFKQQAGTESPAPAGQVVFALKCGSLNMTPCTLAASEQGAGLEQALLSKGFDPTVPTIWVAEGLVMYLDLATLRGLLSDMAHLSPTGSTAIITTISKEGIEFFHSTFSESQQAGGMAKLRFHNTLDDLTDTCRGVQGVHIAGISHPPVRAHLTGDEAAGSPSGLLHEYGWSVVQVGPDLQALLPQLAPGHCSSGYGVMAPEGEIEGLVVATRE